MKFSKEKFFEYMYSSFSISWRGPILSIADLLERIVTVQDYKALEFLFYNYPNHAEVIDTLFHTIEKQSHYSKEYEMRYKKVVNTFNFLRFHGRMWPLDFVPEPIMDGLIQEIEAGKNVKNT